MDKIKKSLRSVFLVILIIVAIVLTMIRLMKFQLVEGAEYFKISTRSTQGNQEISAPRGEIVDINGTALVANRISYDMIIEYALFPKDVQQQNEIILSLAKYLIENSMTYEETLPVTTTQPYTYLDGKESLIEKVLANLRLNKYATAQNVVDKLIEQYEISDEYTQDEKRIIAGIRYEMLANNFSINNRYTFAKDLSNDIATNIKEQSFNYPGVDIDVNSIRIYPDGTIFPHGLGTVGPIYAEEYATLKEQGYKMNDTIGKAGIEKVMEDYLKGTNGTRTVYVNNTNNVVSVEETVPAQPGNTVVLTIDSEFQAKVQDIIKYHIEWNQANGKDAEFGKEAYAGSAVVIDVKTGAVKAMTTYPSYDINDYKTKYNEILVADNQPLYNRAIDGLYRPGSTFKTITATAALNEGLIDKNTTIICNKVYTYYSDYHPECLQAHGAETVTTALRDSCNIFFYDVGRRLGNDKLAEYENMFGFGTDLNFELGGQNGFLATPDTYQKLNMPWTPGLQLLASIGQSEVGVTPLNMAVQAMTLANKGVRYRPYIVDSVISYDGEETILKTEPVVEQVIEDKTGTTFDVVKEGMIMAGAYLTPYPGQATPDLPYKVALKTGTPEQGSYYNTAAIAYYPADNPEIAISVLIEKGWNAKMTIKKIIEAYYGYNNVQDEQISIAQ